MKSSFSELPIMLVHDTSDILTDIPYLKQGVGCLVRPNSQEACIIINIDNVTKTLKSDENLKSKSINSFIDYIDAHESVHYLESHNESSDDNELKADVYATCLCELKNLNEASEIGLYKLQSSHGDTHDITTLLHNCKQQLIT